MWRRTAKRFAPRQSTSRGDLTRIPATLNNCQRRREPRRVALGTFCRDPRRPRPSELRSRSLIGTEQSFEILARPGTSKGASCEMVHLEDASGQLREALRALETWLTRLE